MQISGLFLNAALKFIRPRTVSSNRMHTEYFSDVTIVRSDLLVSNVSHEHVDVSTRGAGGGEGKTTQSCMKNGHKRVKSRGLQNAVSP